MASPCGQKNTCENIALPQTPFVGGENHDLLLALLQSVYSLNEGMQKLWLLWYLGGQWTNLLICDVRWRSQCDIQFCFERQNQKGVTWIHHYSFLN